MKTARFQRLAPEHSRQVRTTKMIRVGGEWLDHKEAGFVTDYARHFNGTRAAESIGVSRGAPAAVSAHDYLRKPNVRNALRGLLEERRRRIEVDADQVARYWLDVAHADPRELSQVIYVPCRYCWGVDHQYQFTDGELRDSRQLHMSRQLARKPEDRVVFDELGGPGYSTNRYPMRGPDWLGAVERVYSHIGRPVPEGLDTNSDHSCPECSGSGERRAWIADTRHLSPEAARLFGGVRVTRDSIEIKMRSQSDAMEKFEQLTGMVKARRPKFDFNLEELGPEELDALLDEARSRGLLSDEEVTRGRLIDATPDTVLPASIDEEK